LPLISHPAPAEDKQSSSEKASSPGGKLTSLLARRRAFAWELWLRSDESLLWRRRIAWGLVLALALAYAVIVGVRVVTRFTNYHADAFDLGNMDQAVWNTLHGHLFRFTNRGNDDFNAPTRLSIHVEPILLLLAPLYLIYAGPPTLLITQTVAQALGSIPLFLLSLRRLPKLPLMGVAIVFSYLISPLLLGAALWDFHAVALATPLLIWALWALDARRYRQFLVAVTLAAATKEDVGLSIALIGIVFALWPGRTPRQRTFGLIVAAVSLVYVALCFFVILPHFSVHTSNNYLYRYSWLKGFEHDPFGTLASLLNAGRRLYLAILFRTAGGLGIFAPVVWAFALPDFAVNMLSNHAEQYSGFFQYNAVILPYLCVAAVYGVEVWYSSRRGVERPIPPAPFAERKGDDAVGAAAVSLSVSGRLAVLWRRVEHYERAIGAWWVRLVGRIPLPSRWIGPVVIVWVIALSIWNVTTVGRIAPFWAAGAPPTPQQAQHITQVDALLGRIPSDASVATTDTLDPHLSDRYDLYLMPDPQCYQAQYVAVDLPNAIGNVRQQDQQMLDRMLASGRYVVIGKAGDVLVLHRIGPPLT